MPIQRQSQPWSAQVAFVAGDASKTIKNGRASQIMVVTRVIVRITTSAAQTIDIEDTSGAVEVMKLAASPPVNSEHTFTSEHGIRLTIGENLIYKPAAAGNAGHITAEGYVEGGF